MVFGKLKKEFYSRKPKKFTWFAVVPIRLRDGRWIWLEKVCKYFETWRCGGIHYYVLSTNDVRYSTATNTNVL
jgi:hypothetical protein